MRRSAFTSLLCLLIALLLMAIFGCSKDANPTAPPIDSSYVPLPADKTDYLTVEGEVGGAYYVLYRPAEWNGDLVIVAHGFTTIYDGPEPPGSDEWFLMSCRDGLLELGYGVAYSSYPELGWSVKEAMISLHQLKGLYTANFGRPNDTYLAGLSMGGLIVVGLAEKYPKQYAGVLTESGPLGGAQMVFNQVFNVRALFDYYYPGVLPGTVLEAPPDLDLWGATVAAIDAMLNDPGPLIELASIEQLDFRYEGFEELVTIMMWHLYTHMNAVNELVERIGGSPLDNGGTWYSGTSNDEVLNAGVLRFTSPQNARNYLKRYYEPIGMLRVPVLSLHNTRDPLVPLGHQESYAARVAANGCSNFLQQQYIERQDHGFTTEETISAFQELVAWVQSLERSPSLHEEPEHLDAAQ